MNQSTALREFVSGINLNLERPSRNLRIRRSALGGRRLLYRVDPNVWRAVASIDSGNRIYFIPETTSGTFVTVSDVTIPGFEPIEEPARLARIRNQAQELYFEQFWANRSAQECELEPPYPYLPSLARRRDQ